KRGAGARLLVLFAGRDRARGPERTAADPELHVRIDRRLVEHVPASQQADPGRAGLRVRELAALGLLVAKGGNVEAAAPSPMRRHPPQRRKFKRSASLHAPAAIVAVVASSAARNRKPEA